MLDLKSARDRAIRRAIEIGTMPNMDLIHARQRMEGYEACFGRAEGVCHRTHCRWHADCTALALFKPVRGLGLNNRRRIAPGLVTRVTFGGFRASAAQAGRKDDGSEPTKAASSRVPEADTGVSSAGAIRP